MRMRVTSSPIGSPAERGIQPPGDVLQQLGAVVEGAALHQFQEEVLVAVVDAAPSGPSGDHGEDHHSEPVDQARRHQRTAQAHAAERMDRFGGGALQLAHPFHGIAGQYRRVGQRVGRFQGGRDDHLVHGGEPGERIALVVAEGRVARCALCHPGHQLVGRRSHQGGEAVLRRALQPAEVLRPLKAPPSRPALGRTVPVERGDEVNHQLLVFLCGPLAHGSSNVLSLIAVLSGVVSQHPALSQTDQRHGTHR